MYLKCLELSVRNLINSIHKLLTPFLTHFINFSSSSTDNLYYTIIITGVGVSCYGLYNLYNIVISQRKPNNPTNNPTKQDIGVDTSDLHNYEEDTLSSITPTEFKKSI